MSSHSQPVGLDLDACRARLLRLRQTLTALGAEAALMTDRRHVHYLSGYWHFSSHTATALWVPVHGESILVTPHPIPDPGAAERSLNYESKRLSTMVDDHYAGILTALQPCMQGATRVAADDPRRPWLAPRVTWIDLLPALLAMRRTKEPDEIRLIGRAIACAEAAYARARDILRPGLLETHLFAEMQAAAFEAAGEYIGDFGNDFQCGSKGGAPRLRPAEAAEIAVLDVTVIYRGYCCDLCRSMSVGGRPSSAQSEAHRLLMEALTRVEEQVRPGLRCRALYEDIQPRLNGRNGWSFTHHLGHGIGLYPHEAPRLNPNWDDVFQPGDVFTAEPGLYGPDLRGGLRIEQNYLVIPEGARRLSAFPTEL